MITSITPSNAQVGATVTIAGTGFSSQIAENNLTFNGTTSVITSATSTQLVTTVPANATSGILSLTVKGVTVQSSDDFQVANSWKSIADFAGTPRPLTGGFSINGKGYAGGFGESIVNNAAVFYKDFWEYDPATNVWTQKADFAGPGRDAAVSFAIGSKGYITTGSGASGYLKDLWEYDPATNAWTQKEDLGGAGRSGAVGFAVGSKGYIGTGQGSSAILKDFWEFDQASGHWTQKADLAGVARRYGIGVAVGSKGYIGGGNTPNSLLDFYEYDPASNQWTQKANCPHSFVLPQQFGAGSKVFVGLGGLFYEYDPSNNVWTRRADFPGTNLYINGTAFSIGNYGYIGLSETQAASNNYLRAFYQYTPIQ
ncbi:hypothetical protein WSM22_36060 [Cytophagales bacterium WSM2-2]|nr:hypothetical protein WSM22_36060 [Cytophagales bacterium WSM2-2]